MLQRVIETPRLRLRPWTDQDLPAFAAMNADARVMEYFPKPLTSAESDFFADRIRKNLEQHGFGLWALEIPGVAPFAGFVGLSIPNFQAHFTPCVEVGWRLAYQHWGKGYAPEAANAVLNFGFCDLHLDQIVSFTTAANQRSRRVMEKLHMTYSPADDFDHPNLHKDHPVRRHVLYRIARHQFSPLPAPTAS